MLPGFSKSYNFLQTSLRHTFIEDSVYAYLFNSRQLVHDSYSASVFSIVRKAILANNLEYFQHIKQLSLEHPRILTLKDKEGYNLLCLAHKIGSKDLENTLIEAVKIGIKEEYATKILKDFKAKNHEELIQQQKAFAAGSIIGKIVLHPGLEYLDDSITDHEAVER
jgi:hypothetical protein